MVYKYAVVEKMKLTFPILGIEPGASTSVVGFTNHCATEDLEFTRVKLI
jgi:hypothetical protein